MGMRKRAGATVASAAAMLTVALSGAPAWAQDLVGQPTPGGIGLQPDPRDYSAVTSEDQVDRSKTFYSVGFGYRFGEQFALDLGWMQERFDDFYQPYGDVDSTPPVVDESVVRNRFVVGVRVGF